MNVKTIDQTQGPAKRLKQAAKICEELKVMLEKTGDSLDRTGVSGLFETMAGMLAPLWLVSNVLGKENASQLKSLLTKNSAGTMLHVLNQISSLLRLDIKQDGRKAKIIVIKTDLDLLAKKLSAIADADKEEE